MHDMWLNGGDDLMATMPDFDFLKIFDPSFSPLPRSALILSSRNVFHALTTSCGFRSRNGGEA